MENPFVAHLDRWLPQILRLKAIASVREEHLAVIGANDFAAMLADFVLGRLAIDPDSCWTGCDIDELSDAAIISSAGMNAEIVGVGLLSVVVELSRWQGDDAVQFLIAHEVPADDARQFVDAVDVVAEKLSERGRRLLEQVDAAYGVSPAGAPTFATALD